MRPDVIDLREFYHSRLGQVARHLLRYRIRRLWPAVGGMRVLGLGYAVPYLRQFRDEAERVISIMPAAQGVHRWPADAGNLVALADEQELPLPDASIDRVLLMHELENAEQVRPLLREVWRVMASGGRLLVAVPNRRGIWARAAGPLEKLGQSLGPALAGVLLVEAEKQIYAATAVRQPRRRRPVALPMPLAEGRASRQSLERNADPD